MSKIDEKLSAMGLILPAPMNPAYSRNSEGKVACA